ncbi:MAG: FAD-dependent oxidoreductase [Acidimicrobiales bacterium]|nr:FAD-dependent oxidoreductase [Acidimicrobiales bacterium]
MTRTRRYEVAVVGAGMLGASTARHLADAGCDVALVGVAESGMRANRTVHASHYDVARVSRTIDPDPVRAWLGHQSVSQFAAVEARTGVRVVNPVGHLWVESPEGVSVLASADQRFNLGCVRRSADETKAAFPFLSLDSGSTSRAGNLAVLDSLWEPPPAGSVDPRAHVRAETAAAVDAGATHLVALVDGVVESSDGVTVASDQGTITADRVLLATGAFSEHGISPAAGLDLEYALHTQLLVHLDAVEADRLAGLPSVIAKFADPMEDFYLTPPVADFRSVAGAEARYILKIGGPQNDHVRATVDELVAWFCTDGDTFYADNLARSLAWLLPDLRDVGRWTSSCVTTYTPSGHPFVDQLTDRTYCAIGGNGYAAKCAPALGGLAAGLMLEWSWPTEVDRELFLACFTG